MSEQGKVPETVIRQSVRVEDYLGDVRAIQKKLGH